MHHRVSISNGKSASVLESVSCSQCDGIACRYGVSGISAERENKQRTQAGLTFPFWACDAFEAERVERVWECFFTGAFAAFSEDFFVVGGGAGSPFPRIMDPNSRSVRALAYAGHGVRAIALRIFST